MPSITPREHDKLLIGSIEDKLSHRRDTRERAHSYSAARRHVGGRKDPRLRRSCSVPPSILAQGDQQELTVDNPGSAIVYRPKSLIAMETSVVESMRFDLALTPVEKITHLVTLDHGNESPPQEAACSTAFSAHTTIVAKSEIFDEIPVVSLGFIRSNSPPTDLSTGTEGSPQCDPTIVSASTILPLHSISGTDGTSQENITASADDTQSPSALDGADQELVISSALHFIPENLISPLLLPFPANFHDDEAIQNLAREDVTSLTSRTSTAATDACETLQDLPVILVTSPLETPLTISPEVIKDLHDGKTLEMETRNTCPDSAVTSGGNQTASLEGTPEEGRSDELLQTIAISPIEICRDQELIDSISKTLPDSGSDLPRIPLSKPVQINVCSSRRGREDSLALRSRKTLNVTSGRQRANSLPSLNISRLALPLPIQSIGILESPVRNCDFANAVDVPARLDLSCSTSSIVNSRPRPRGRQLKRKGSARSKSQESAYPRKRIRIKRTVSFTANQPANVPTSIDAMKRDVRNSGTKLGAQEASVVTTPPIAKRATSAVSSPELAAFDDIGFEEAQAMLTIMKRSGRFEEIASDIEIPQTPRNQASVGPDPTGVPGTCPITPPRETIRSDRMSKARTTTSPSYSEIRSKKRKAEDAKSTRTLRKPFKTPLVPGRALKRYLGSSSPPFVADTDLLDTPPSSSIVTGNASLLDKKPFPTFESAHSKRYVTRRLAKPFKSPSFSLPTTASELPSSDAIDPPSSPTHPPARRTTVLTAPSTEASVAPSRASEISALEVRKQVLNQALKIIHNQEDEERLSQLHEQWLAAGREITEKLFSVVPEPTEQNPGHANSNSYYQEVSIPVPRSEEAENREGESAVNGPKVTKEWNMGSMLDMFGIDAALFGWIEEQEDWNF